MADNESETLVERVSRERGFRRRWHRTVAQYDPEILRLYHDYYSHVYEMPALPKKVKELIIIGIDCIQQWPGIRAHILNAKRAGATNEEIVEAIVTAGVPGGVHAMAFGLDAFDDAQKEMERNDPLPEI